MRDVTIIYPDFELDQDDLDWSFKDYCKFLYTGRYAWAICARYHNKIMDLYENENSTKYNAVVQALFEIFVEQPYQETLERIQKYQDFLIPWVEEDGHMLRQVEFDFLNNKAWVSYPIKVHDEQAELEENNDDDRLTFIEEDEDTYRNYLNRLREFQSPAPSDDESDIIILH